MNLPIQRNLLELQASCPMAV